MEKLTIEYWIKYFNISKEWKIILTPFFFVFTLYLVFQIIAIELLLLHLFVLENPSIIPIIGKIYDYISYDYIAPTNQLEYFSQIQNNINGLKEYIFFNSGESPITEWFGFMFFLIIYILSMKFLFFICSKKKIKFKKDSHEYWLILPAMFFSVITLTIIEPIFPWLILLLIIGINGYVIYWLLYKE